MSRPRVGCSINTRRKGVAATKAAPAAGCRPKATRPVLMGVPLMLKEAIRSSPNRHGFVAIDEKPVRSSPSSNVRSAKDRGPDPLPGARRQEGYAGILNVIRLAGQIDPVQDDLPPPAGSAPRRPQERRCPLPSMPGQPDHLARMTRRSTSLICSGPRSIAQREHLTTGSSPPTGPAPG